MLMLGRSYSSTAYKYGFNGQEKDDEVYGAGNLNTAQFWEYDTRLGRRWNIDPVVKPWQSRYDCFSDNPIINIDPEGDDDYKVNKKGEIKFLKATKDEKDKLIAVWDKKESVFYNKKGELQNSAIEVKKGILDGIRPLKTKDGNKTINGLELDFKNDQEQGEKVFKFLANNTTVEWGLVNSENENNEKDSKLFTSHINDREYFSSYYVKTLAVKSSFTNEIPLKSLIHMHNHPTPEDFHGKPSDKDLEFYRSTKSFFKQARFYIHENGKFYDQSDKK
ncbi:MAG: hypothetical protein JNL95_12290 [Chitinophagales bacterium]|nr:hypothetical protein [Chitinophagales bacterium]